MNRSLYAPVPEACKAAVEVLLHNRKGPFEGLFRTAGWGYPEPYTRDLMISSFGILASGNEQLIESLRLVLKSLAKHQSRRGHIPSLAHDPEDRGASDTTPLFLLALALFRKFTGENHFLEEASIKALTWLDYQSPEDRVLIGQLPTSDWRDEQWVLGYGLYVNILLYIVLNMYGLKNKAALLKNLMNNEIVRDETKKRHVHEGFMIPGKPYYAMWTYKIHSNTCFDLLGNLLAVLSGIHSGERARELFSWIDDEMISLKQKGDLTGYLPPCFFPYVYPGDPDWNPRYALYNRPGEYHNGGIWPFICGFYIPAMISAGLHSQAENRLQALCAIVQPARDLNLAFGFNEWLYARNNRPGGQDWQTWSASMFLYAAACVEKGEALFF